MPEHFDADVASVAALAEPIRRDLYRYVAEQDEPVGREQAATGVGIAFHAAKFHLDKLVEDGLLDVEYSRPPGRSGPGAGRPAKRYRRSHRDIAVSLPPRHYELAAEVMAQAIEAAQRTGIPVTRALSEAAEAAGRALADQVVGESVLDVLAANGYEPRGDDRVTMVNCPFHRLAQAHTALTCGLNLDLINGLLTGLRETRLRAALDPAPGRCCVTISRT